MPYYHSLKRGGRSSRGEAHRGRGYIPGLAAAACAPPFLCRAPKKLHRPSGAAENCCSAHLVLQKTAAPPIWCCRKLLLRPSGAAENRLRPSGAAENRFQHPSTGKNCCTMLILFNSLHKKKAGRAGQLILFILFKRFCPLPDEPVYGSGSTGCCTRLRRWCAHGRCPFPR